MDSSCLGQSENSRDRVYKPICKGRFTKSTWIPIESGRGPLNSRRGRRLTLIPQQSSIGSRCLRTTSRSPAVYRTITPAGEYPFLNIRMMLEMLFDLLPATNWSVNLVSSAASGWDCGSLLLLKALPTMLALHHEVECELFCCNATNN